MSNATAAGVFVVVSLVVILAAVLIVRVTETVSAPRRRGRVYVARVMKTTEERTMRKTLTMLAAGGALLSMFAVDADAGGAGCGKGNHRGRDGACAVAGQTVNVGPPTRGPNGQTTCPPGTRLGNNGRNCKRD
jgi:hypothetical protein